MKKHIYKVGLIAALALTGCSDIDYDVPGQLDGSQTLITLAGQITQECVSRANDDGFADGDVMGVYIVDYEGTTAGTLKNSGNRGDNVRHTFDEAGYRWSSAYDLYWKDKHTRIDVYGYYPFASIDDVNNYNFTVQADQARTFDDGSMGNYEASDFLWGKVGGVEPTTNVIRLPLTHRMANARVNLVQGSGFADGEWAELSKQVLVTNTIQEAVIDMATGSVTAEGTVGKNSIIPTKRGDEWRAIVVPQTITAGTTMFSITLGGIPYKFSKDENFEYVAGKMSNFGIKVDKKEPSGDYTLTLISESITPWEDDLVSHDATAKEYVVIDVPEAGTLAECIASAGKNIAEVKNIKITGKINSKDFAVMKYDMTYLTALNLKDVEIVAGQENTEEVGRFYYGNAAGAIPGEALQNKESLVTLVLPDKLKSIGGNAFSGCKNLSGSLIIPEGVETIERAAFWDCTSLTGTLSLPTTLKRLGGCVGYMPYWDGVFGGCRFTCELILPESLEEIGMGTFKDCKNLYGSLRLPENLKLLGAGAFQDCKNLTGALEIPQGVTNIPFDAFNGCWLSGTLSLHDGITAIGENAFANNGFRGELNLPKNLEVISHGAFYNDDFLGELVLPKGLRTIGERCFAYNWRLMGVLEIPENVINISAGAFAHCRSLEGVIFPEGLESISYEDAYYDDGGAFQGCYSLGKMICKSEIPPYIQEGAFNGVAKDNFVVEVPETSVTQYQVAPGWCDFKRISAHHELVCRPSIACALHTEHKSTLVIDAEGEWELESKPDWCELSQTSGNKKSEVILTIKAGSQTENREGDVVFKLKGKDYTHRCHVTQYGYQYAEDEVLTLQSATKGNNGGINLVFLGDGYDAKDISEGNYLKDIQDGVEDFFGIEPYNTYRDYFNVYTAFPLSTESGVGSVNTIRYNRFNTTNTGGMGYRCDYDELFEYVMACPTVTVNNINQTLIVMIPNSTDYSGICMLWEDGSAVAFCPKSDYGYPLDSRGVMQHEAGGHGFGKLGDEYIYHNAFIDACGCSCCGFHQYDIMAAKSRGWYDNLELTGKMHQVGWSHLIFDPRYSDIVDIFEGGYMHTRGVFRSEQNSCMNNDIPYYSTISRQSIVKRIKEYAGETFDFEEFVALDKRGLASTSRTTDVEGPNRIMEYSMPPVIHKGSPLKKH